MLCVIDPADSMDIEVHNETLGHCQFNTKNLFENLGDFATPCANSITTFEEGIFVLLPDEMRLEIFSKLVAENDWANLNAACGVNWRWKVEIEEIWRNYCEKQNLLQDEQIWVQKGKNWKWVCACLTTIVQESEKNGFGSTQRTIAVGESKYEGEWKDGKKEGVGRMWWHNGDRYLGDWKGDTKDGYGYMIWANGDNYEGTWKQDLRHGEDAKYTYANGGTFVGTYVNDERHGEGSYYWPDGDCFKGTWQSGGRKGKGVLITKDGNAIEQEWNESPYVNYSDAVPAKYPTAPAHESSHPNSG